MNVVIDKWVADGVLKPFKPIREPTPKICENPFIVGIIGMWVMKLEIVKQSEGRFTRKF